MALTFTELTESRTETDGPYTLAAGGSVTAGSLVLVCFAVSGDFATAVSPSTLSGVCGSWTIAKAYVVEAGVNLYFFRGTATGTGNITVDWTEDTFAAAWTVIEIGGANTTTPIVQTGENLGASGTTASVTLSAFASGTNGVVSCALIDTSSAAPSATHEGGYTELTDQTGFFDFSVFHVQVKASSDTTPSATWGVDAGSWGMIAAEIAESAAGTTMTPAQGPLTLTGATPGLGFTINMPDEL
jgi:hypothetical protein